MKDLHTFGELIQGNKIVIPKIQRDYVQGSNAQQEKRDEFLAVLLDHLVSGKEYHLDFIFDQDIAISSHYTFNWPVTPPIALTSYPELVDSRTLRVHLQEDALSGSLVHPIQIGAGSVINKQFVGCGNIYLQYTVTGNVP